MIFSEAPTVPYLEIGVLVNCGLYKFCFCFLYYVPDAPVGPYLEIGVLLNFG